MYTENFILFYPPVPLFFDEFPDPFLFDVIKVFDHAHMIFRPVPFIQVLQSLAWKFCTFKGTIFPVIHLYDITIQDLTFCQVPCSVCCWDSTSIASPLFHEMCVTKVAIHATGRNKT